MNTDNVKVSIRAVEERKNFDMRNWVNVAREADITCGTAACIAGCTALTPEFKQAGGGMHQGNPGLYIVLADRSGFGALARFWGISWLEAHSLCAGRQFYRVDELGDVTREMALAALNHLLETGSTEGFQP